MLHRSLPLVAAVLLALPALAQEAPRGMEPEDYYDLVFVSDPQIAPDGRTVAFVRSTITEDRRGRASSVWLVPTDGGEPRPLTRGTSDRAPRWAPDGRRLAFLSGRDGPTQLFLLRLDGGEPAAATALRQGAVTAAQWAPDGRALLLAISVDPAVEDPTAEPERPEGPQADVVVIRHAVYKEDGRGYLDERRTTLWRLDLAEDDRPGTLTRLVADPRWNARGATLSPDGRLVAFVADTTGAEFDGAHATQLFVVPFEGGALRRIPTPEGRVTDPTWAPDGRRLAYRFQPGRYEPVEVHVTALDAPPGAPPRVLHDGLDLTASGLSWPTGEALFFGADFRGTRPLFRLAPGQAPDSVVVRRGSVASPSFSADGRRVAFTWEDERHPAEVHVADLARPGAVRALTDFNGPLRARLALQPAEPFWFTNEQGFEVQAWVVRPVGFREDARHPVVLNIKGGPSGMWGHQWFHEFQMMAARGYAVVFTNYRGSTGYGHAFQSAVRLDYGGADFRDNIQALDEALARFPWLDPDRQFVTGGSHGGFLTNWITTQTDRFRAAVTQRSVSNWISEAGTQAYPPAAMREEFGGTIWENFDYYWGRSPLRLAYRVRTPTLVIHSTEDHITPIGQGEEWFYALKANDVPVEMVVFRGENHGLSRTGTPVNLVERLRRILGWFERWDVGGEAVAAR